MILLLSGNKCVVLNKKSPHVIAGFCYLTKDIKPTNINCAVNTGINLIMKQIGTFILQWFVWIFLFFILINAFILSVEIV